MSRTSTAALILVTIGAVSLGAQTPAPAAPTTRSEPVTTSQNDRNAMPSQNIRIDVAISDTFGTAPTKKAVTLLVADRRTGRIRSSLSVAVPNHDGTSSYRSIGINVDATPEVRPDGRVFVNLSLSYTPDNPAVESGAPQKPASIDESMSVVLSDGKPTLLAQSADPQGDRKVTLEVTATVVK
jgi:hypothetical protein